VGNGKILKKLNFDRLWIQPASGDAGGALGAALIIWHKVLGHPRVLDSMLDSQKGSLLGPSFDRTQIGHFLESQDAFFEFFEVKTHLYEKVAHLLAQGKVVGFFNGKMEFGPRALGARSILGDARSPKMQKIMNLKIKFRESFRPFAPIVLKEDLKKYFELEHESPYMLLVAPLKKQLRRKLSVKERKLFGINKLNIRRSSLPAITHVDYSARIQTVDPQRNPDLYALLNTFKKQTGCAVLVNTSFNVRGEPMVCTPADAYRCFLRTDMDFLVLENFLVRKDSRHRMKRDKSWYNEFSLD
jgi:carbamoyltransferase